MRGWQSIVNRSLNMFTLIGMGVGVAYAYSATATLRPDIFPRRSAARAASVGVYFEAAAAIVTLVLLGQVLEDQARSLTGAAIRALLGLAPKDRAYAHAEDRPRRSPLDQVQPGDDCACDRARRSRSMVSCSKERSAIDESMVTGESHPCREATRESPAHWRRR